MPFFRSAPAATRRTAAAPKSFPPFQPSPAEYPSRGRGAAATRLRRKTSTERQPRRYSFRFAEALSHGAIPCVLGDAWVLPFSELLDYSSFAVCVREADVALVPQLLGEIAADPARVDAMQAAGRAAFDRYFADLGGTLDGLLEVLRRRRDGEERRYQVAGDIAVRPS